MAVFKIEIRNSLSDKFDIVRKYFAGELEIKDGDIISAVFKDGTRIPVPVYAFLEDSLVGSLWFHDDVLLIPIQQFSVEVVEKREGI